MFASQPYCGVYAIYGAAKAIGSDVEFQELVDPQFIRAVVAVQSKTCKRLPITSASGRLHFLGSGARPYLQHLTRFACMSADSGPKEPTTTGFSS